MTEPGRHRGAGRVRRPPAKPPDPTIPLGVAAGLLIAASLVAIAGTAVAPDARAAAAQTVTAPRSPHTDHVPLMIGPLALPTIGAEGIWDPEATPSLFAGARTTGSAPAGASQTTPTGTRSAGSTSQAVTATLVTLESASPSESATPASATTTPSPTSTAAATTTSSATTTTEEPTLTTTPTTTASPTDVIGDVIGQVLGTAIGETP